jgi:hypothetical protein
LRSRPVSVAEELVEAGDARTRAPSAQLVSRVVDVAEPGEHLDAVSADPVGVRTGPETAAAQFQDPQGTALPLAVLLGRQDDGGVGDGELRTGRQLVLAGQRAAPACPGADDVGGTTTGKLCRNGADEKGQYVVYQLPEEKETSLPSDAVPE